MPRSHGYHGPAQNADSLKRKAFEDGELKRIKRDLATARASHRALVKELQSATEHACALEGLDGDAAAPARMEVAWTEVSRLRALLEEKQLRLDALHREVLLPAYEGLRYRLGGGSPAICFGTKDLSIAEFDGALTVRLRSGDPIADPKRGPSAGVGPAIHDPQREWPRLEVQGHSCSRQAGTGMRLKIRARDLRVRGEKGTPGVGMIPRFALIVLEVELLVDVSIEFSPEPLTSEFVKQMHNRRRSSAQLWSTLKWRPSQRGVTIKLLRSKSPLPDKIVRAAVLSSARTE